MNKLQKILAYRDAIKSHCLDCTNKECFVGQRKNDPSTLIEIAEECEEKFGYVDHSRTEIIARFEDCPYKQPTEINTSNGNRDTYLYPESKYLGIAKSPIKT